MARTRTFTLDLPPGDDRPPVAGDLLLSTRTAYFVSEVRPVDSKVWCNRFALIVRPLGPYRPEHVKLMERTGRIHRSGSYPKNMTVAEWWRQHGYTNPVTDVTEPVRSTTEHRP